MTVRTAPLAQCISDEQLVIVALDDAYLDILGRPRADVVGRCALDFTAPVDRAVNGLLLQRLDSDGQPFAITKRYVRGDGAVQWVDNHVAAYSDGIGPRRILATCRLRAEPAIVADLARIRQDAIGLARLLASAKHAFGGDLIGSPALEALLHLHLAEMEGRSLTPRCIAALIGQGEQTTLRWIRLLDQRHLAEVEDATPIDLGAPIRITGPAQWMMEDLAGMLRPFSGE